MYKHGEGQVISHHSSYLCVLIGSTYAGMMKHSFTINSVIQGYHVYKDVWDTIGSSLL